jgi:hypothetical protein
MGTVSGQRWHGFFNRPAFSDRKAVRQADEKDLDFKIKKNDIPHSQPAIENEILGDEHSTLEVKLYQDQAKPPVFQEMGTQAL